MASDHKEPAATNINVIGSGTPAAAIVITPKSKGRPYCENAASKWSVRLTEISL